MSTCDVTATPCLPRSPVVRLPRSAARDAIRRDKNTRARRRPGRFRLLLFPNAATTAAPGQERARTANGIGASQSQVAAPLSH